MNISDINTLYRYNEWANQRLIDAATILSPEALTRDLGGSFKCIRDVVAHIITAEWAWLERCGGVSPSSIPDWVDGDLSVLTKRLRDVEEKRLHFFQQLSEATLSSQVAFHFISGTAGVHTLSDLLFHVVNHSTYHRGQLASMLRQLGVVPPSTDFIVFMAEMR